MGRGPKDIHAHLLGDLRVVRLEGVLTAAEQHLVKSLTPRNGRELLTKVLNHLLGTARPILEAIVQEVAGSLTCTVRWVCDRVREESGRLRSSLNELSGDASEFLL